MAPNTQIEKKTRFEVSPLKHDFQQIDWDEQLQSDWGEILQLAINEDLAHAGDLTTAALVPENAPGRAAIVARQSGVIAGLAGVPAILAAIDHRLHLNPKIDDGHAVEPGDTVAVLEGPARGILMAERLTLNLLGRMSGIATLTRRYVEATSGTNARIYDTRKTTPGWRRLEKYAVRCGGGYNHRTGLFEAVLIKDNHLALGATVPGAARFTPAEAVERARQYAVEHGLATSGKSTLVEIEVDTLQQLDEVLPAAPDIVLLDNMSTDELRAAVSRRNAVNPEIDLEASGGVNLDTVAAIARTGVDRISVGALTHSAVCLDLGLDWL